MALSTGTCVQVLAATPICSTEKINSDCYVYVDRYLPISMPTFQMKPGSHILVTVLHPFHFETLTLDPQTIQALPGTDQGGSLATSALPDLKGLTGAIHTVPYIAQIQKLNLQDTGTKAGKEISDLQRELADAIKELPQTKDRLNAYADHAAVVYAQLKEIESPVPRPTVSAVPAGSPKRIQGVPAGPYPWSDYDNWRVLLLCELAGDKDTCPGGGAASFSNVIQEGNDLVAGLPTLKDGTYSAPAETTLFELNSFDDDLDQASSDADGTADPALRTKYQAAVVELGKQSQLFFQKLYVYSSNVTKVDTDLQTYQTNISVWQGSPTQTAIEKSADGQEELQLGVIADPKSSFSAAAPSNMLGRQIVYSINAENQVANLALTVPTAAQKISVVTITALFADPRFEMSAGSIISFQHNRSFANMVAVAPPPGSSLNKGDTYISETRSRPQVIPIVTANYRLTNEFAWWGTHRRGAFYGSIWVGLNPYNALPEFGAGPTLSFRSILISALYHRSHDVRLTQGEYPGQVWCNVYATTPGTGGGSGTGVSCTPSAPAPSTQTYWTNAFGIGISIRVPTSFAAGTGGVSR